MCASRINLGRPNLSLRGSNTGWKFSCTTENPFTASAIGPFNDRIKYSNFCSSAKAELSTMETLIDWL